MRHLTNIELVRCGIHQHHTLLPDDVLVLPLVSCSLLRILLDTPIRSLLGLPLHTRADAARRLSQAVALGRVTQVELRNVKVLSLLLGMSSIRSDMGLESVSSKLQSLGILEETLFDVQLEGLSLVVERLSILRLRRRLDREFKLGHHSLLKDRVI